LDVMEMLMLDKIQSWDKKAIADMKKASLYTYDHIYA
jgi:hypothetical protein